MGLPVFQRLAFTDRLLALFQENVARVVDPLASDRGVGRRTLEDTGDGLKQGISLAAASTTLVSHGMGRKVLWKVVDVKEDARVWRDAASTADEALFLALKCSANCTVKLEVW